MTMMPRQTLLNLLGLITTPNEYGAFPEGSLAQAHNVVAREQNQWIPAFDTDLVISDGSSGDIAYRIVRMGAGRFLVITVDSATYSAWGLAMDGDASTPLTLPYPPVSASGLFSAEGYLQPITARNRLFLNSKQGMLVLDTTSPSTSAERKLRMGGLPQPNFNSAGLNTSKTAIPADTTIAYQAVFRRKYSDGYVVVSPPSPPIKMYAYADMQIEFAWNWKYAGDIREGDELELYRTAGLNGVGKDANPGTSMRKVLTYVITADNESATYCNINDAQPMTAPLYETTGEEIYTSPYEYGATGANLAPPICKTVAQWGDYTFYANITDDPIWTLDIPAGIGSGTTMTDAFVREFGIGQRDFSGTITAGSPIITGISAADMVGLAVGQIWYGLPSEFSYTATVIAVGATSVTMSENAGTSAAPESFCRLVDRIEVNGSLLGIYGHALSLLGLTSLNPPLAVYPSEPILYEFASSTTHDVGVTFVLRPMRAGTISEITLRATNGANYSPPLPELTETAKTISTTELPNVFRWSRQNQPEAVPSGNEGYAGSAEIIRMLPTTDQLWLMCTDGLRRLTGAAGQWQLDLVDPGFIPVTPDAACVMFDTLYAYTQRGFAAVSGTEARPLSRGVIDAEFPVRPFSADRKIQVFANETTEEVLALIQDATISEPTTLYVYSTLYGRWSTVTHTEDSLLCASSYDPGTGDAAYILFGVWRSSGKPNVYKWPGTFPLDPTIRLQPVYAGDPMVLKQWIDMTWILQKVNYTGDQAIFATIEGVQISNVYMVKGGARDWRNTFGIPRRWAISEAIEPGLQLGWTSNKYAQIKGLSLRYVPLTNQSRHR